MGGIHQVGFVPVLEIAVAAVGNLRAHGARQVRYGHDVVQVVPHDHRVENHVDPPGRQLGHERGDMFVQPLDAPLLVVFASDVVQRNRDVVQAGIPQGHGFFHGQ